MSDKTQAKSEGEGEGGGKKKRKGLLIAIVAAVVLLLAGGGGAVWVFLSKGDGEQTALADKPRPKHPPWFVTLEPFVVNLAGEVQHYLQVGIDLKVSEAVIEDQIKAHLPEIRNGVLLLLSSKNAEELGTLEGKNLLRREIRAAVNAPLGIESADGNDAHTVDGHGADEVQGVQEVLLTSFVIQ